MKHNRRTFLKQSVLTSIGAGLGLTGCGQRRSTPEATRPQDNEPPAPATPVDQDAPTSPAAALPVINSAGAEVWAWEKQMTGSRSSCETIQIQVSEQDQPVEASVEGETFSAVVPLGAGENRVTAACNDGSSQSEQVTFTVLLRNTPLAMIDIQIENSQIVLNSENSQTAPQQSSPLVSYTWSARESNPAPLTMLDPENRLLADDFTGPRLVLENPSQDGEYYITLTAADEQGREDSSTVYFRVAGGQPALDNWDTQNTDWVENAVVYGVIPRKFGSRAIQGIIDRLDDLQDLGINALWLAPINDSPPGDYGYAVRDYFKVRQLLGSEEEFRTMIQEAHRRGIRVLMDFVPNHSSDQHRYFQDTLNHGQNSHYWDYYDRDENGQPTHYFDWTNLPNLNYDNPEVERWMTEAFAYWVREFDVDGFRVDVAWGIRERKPEYWPQWRWAMKRIKPDLLLLAEASARDEFYFTDGFDAAYDWTSQLGRWAWELVFQKANLLTYNLNAALTNPGNGFHPDALIFRFINNNDTDERFITRYGQEMTRVATALLLTLPGIPCVYTGDEIGAEYRPYYDPHPLNWGEDPHKLREYHKTLINLRKSIAGLHSRQWQIVQVEPHVQVYGYLRYVEGDPASVALVLLNFSDQAVNAEVTLPEKFSALTGGGSLIDQLSGETLPAGQALSIPIPPTTARILTAPQPAS